MSRSPQPGPEASGPRSIAAQAITGIALTGESPVVDARTISLAQGAIPGPAGVAAPPGAHNLPRPPARVFVGRGTALGQLAAALADGASAVVTQTVYGLGGVGKSELALHHAHSHRMDYALTWWITAEDPAQIQAALAALAARLCPEVAMASTTADAAGWAMSWLQTHDRWLLIFDNVDEPGDVQPLLGQLTGGHIVVTTRRDTGWGQIAEPIHLDVLDPGPAAELLTTRTGYHAGPDHEVAASIAAELGYLPLALDQAAAYIAQTRITLATYLRRLRQHPAAMYASAASGSAQRTIARLWDITVEAIRGRHPAAIELLHILACYAPDGVPRVILGGADDADKLAVDEALGVLSSYSMITLTPDTASMHRLVQAVILARRPPAPEGGAFGGESPLTTALDWLEHAVPADPDINTAAWPLLRAMLPHAESLATRFPPGRQPRSLGRMHSEFGLFQTSQGQYEQALRLCRSALAIIEATAGPDHIDVAIVLDNLATIHIDLGQPDRALPLQRRALPITEAARGPDHPDTAAALNNLAATYFSMGQFERALPLELRALEIKDAALEPDDPSMVPALNNLAQTYYAVGQPDQALPLLQRALPIAEAAHGPDHPITAALLCNVALGYCALRQPEQALPLMRRALEITEAALGPDHPGTASVMGGLAIIYAALRRHDQALPLLQRALEITEASHGPRHPETMALVYILARAHSALGEADQALPLMQRVLEIAEAAQGPAYPGGATLMDSLARLYSRIGAD